MHKTIWLQMKKPISLTIIAILSLALLFIQAFAFSTPVSAKPTHTPKPNETVTDEVPGQSEKLDKSNKHPGKKYNFKGQVDSYKGGVLVLSVKGGKTITVTVDENTVIKVSGPKNGARTIAPGAMVVVRAVKINQQSYLALRVHVKPGKPKHVHLKTPQHKVN
jgi:hypothetical protein